MPYIKQENRPKFDALIEQMPSMTVGDLNYVFTRLLERFRDKEGVSYATYNAMMGVLTCCQLELYRRQAAPYEDTKIQENGDVWE